MMSRMSTTVCPTYPKGIEREATACCAKCTELYSRLSTINTLVVNMNWLTPEKKAYDLSLNLKRV